MFAVLSLSPSGNVGHNQACQRLEECGLGVGMLQFCSTCHADPLSVA